MLRVLVGCWLAAWLGIVAFLVAVMPLWARFYEQLEHMGFELHLATDRTLQVGEAIGSPVGLVLVTVALGLGLLPLRVARGSSAALVWWFASGAFVAVVLAILGWASLELPLANWCSFSFGPKTPFERALEARPGRPVAMLVFGLSGWFWSIVAATSVWLPTSILGNRRARGSLRVEASRALVLCSLPASVFGALAFLYAARFVPAPDSLVVSPKFAAAGTVALVFYGAALWLRLRRPAPDDVSAPSPPT